LLWATVVAVTPGPEEDEVPQQAELKPAAEPREYYHRAAPKYGAFITTGVLAGLVAAVLVALLGPRSQYSTSSAIGYLGSIFALLGGLAGAGLAVLIERRQNRRSGRR
jgi:uncharacterized protein involved in exopolysaccharide biosynthesis